MKRNSFVIRNRIVNYRLIVFSAFFNQIITLVQNKTNPDHTAQHEPDLVDPAQHVDQPRLVSLPDPAHVSGEPLQVLVDLTGRNKAHLNLGDPDVESNPRGLILRAQTLIVFDRGDRIEQFRAQ